MKYDCQGPELALQGMNDTCFSICSAFSGTPDVYNMDPVCTQTCKDFVEKLRYEVFGVGSCDHQQPLLPVVWEQYPNYVPDLIKKGLTPEDALREGMALCDKNVPLLASQCKDDCRLHYNAIENIEKPMLKHHHTVKNINPVKTESPKEVMSKIEDYKWIILTGLLVVIFLFFYFKRRMNL
jgi:hypothetical protein